jgi:hypothetical protein
MPYLGKPKASNITCCEAIMDELLMDFAFRSMKVDDGFGIEEQCDICPDTETWIEVVGGMCSNGKCMIVLFNIYCIDGSQLMILNNHLGPHFSLLLAIVVLDVSMLEDVLIFNHDVEALVHNFSVFFTIDVVSDLVSF